MSVEIDERILQKARDLQKANEAEIELKKLKPATEGLLKPHLKLLSISDRGCRGRVKICNVLNVPKSEEEFNNEYFSKNIYIDEIITVCGWSKAVRKQGGGRFCFVNLNDGSCHLNLQVIVNSCINNYEKLLKCGAGCCFRFTGKLILSPEQYQEKKGLLKNNVELTLNDNNIHNFEIYGENLDPQKYPLAKKNHGKEFLREVAHLRPRSYFISSVIRIRNALAIATHLFFQSRGFLYIQTPLITTSDCEGGGEMFTVTTLLDESGTIASIPKVRAKLPKKDKREDKAAEVPAETSAKTPEKAKTETVLNGSEAVTTSLGSSFSWNNYLVDYRKDFFAKQAFLTVSGQLSLENICSSMGDVYTFGPTFRAENSHTSRHLAEFWMIEPEIAFSDLYDNMELAESYIKYCIEYVLNNNFDDIYYFEENVEKGLIHRLKNILNEKFVKVTYTNVIDILRESSHRFDVPVEWGMDLQSEHERFLAEHIYKKPVIVYNYPKDLKAFYMKLNEDKKTVAAMDVLVPKIGEVIGGSQREDNLELLDKMITEKKLNMDSYWWYRQLRKFGSHPHSGFGLGFERLIMLVTGVDNIKDTIPFPRYHGHAEF